jgi:hypothetical protein
LSNKYSLFEKYGIAVIDNQNLRKTLTEANNKGQLPESIYHQLMKSAGGSEGEVLLKGNVPAKAVRPNLVSGKLGTAAQGTGKGLVVVGVAVTSYNLYVTGWESLEIGSIDPFAAQVVREGGSWGGGVTGAYMGASVGTFIFSGVGSVIGGITGGVIGGIVGAFGGDYFGDLIDEN